MGTRVPCLFTWNRRRRVMSPVAAGATTRFASYRSRLLARFFLPRHRFALAFLPALRVPRTPRNTARRGGVLRDRLGDRSYPSRRSRRWCCVVIRAGRSRYFARRGSLLATQIAFFPARANAVSIRVPELSGVAPRSSLAFLHASTESKESTILQADSGRLSSMA